MTAKGWIELMLPKAGAKIKFELKNYGEKTRARPATGRMNELKPFLFWQLVLHRLVQGMIQQLFQGAKYLSASSL